MTDHAAAFAREAQHGAPRRPPALHDTLAWAIATAWREQLPPLLLDNDAADGAFVPSYDWLRWYLVGATTAAAARATVTAWFWLSCCDGYSGEENPRFWKRVLSELQRHDGDAPAMSDAMRFFDGPGREFPRVRIETYDFWLVQAFAGRQRTPLDAVNSRQLARMFQRLEPYFVSERLLRTIPLSVQSEDLEIVLTHNDENGRLPPVQTPADGAARRVQLQLRERCESGGEVAFLDALTAELTPVQLPHQSFESPVFQAHSVYVAEWSWKPNPQARDGSLRSRGLDVQEIHCGQDWSDAAFHSGSREATSQLRLLFGIDGPATSRRLRLSLEHPSLSASLFAAVCSVLPHSQTVSALRLGLPRSTNSKQELSAFDNLNWAWLGYSLFHPDDYQSAAKKLELVVDTLPPNAVRILKLMAQGNNLANVESQTLLPASTCYHSAQLQDQTEIRRYPSLTAPIVLRHTIPTERFSVDNATSLDDWVRVVVSGFGFGWVPSASIIAVVSRPPGQSRLQGLRLRYARVASVPRAIDLVMAVGGRLTHLDVTMPGMLPAETLLQLLLACPALKTLSVVHNGSLWASPGLLQHQRLPLLEELSLTVPDSTLLLGSQRHTSLRCLRSLRVIALPAEDNFPRNRVALLAFVQAHPSIEYLHWSDPNSPSQTNVPNRNAYTSRRQRSHLLMGELPHPGSSSGLCLRCRFAVVGAVHAARSATPASALGGLDEDLLSLVFSFSPRCGLRDLWIGP